MQTTDVSVWWARRRADENRLHEGRLVDDEGKFIWNVYLARPMDQAAVSAQRVDVVIDDLTTQLNRTGALVYDPAAWGGAHPPRGDAFPQHVHNAAIDRADACLAVVLGGVPTVGVPIDLERAMRQGKPAVVYTDSQNVAQSPPLAALGVPITTSTAESVFLLHDLVRRAPEPVQMPASIEASIWAFLVTVAREVERAGEKFPDNTPTNTPEDWAAIYFEEAYESIKAWNDFKRDPKKHPLEDLMEEIIQTAAMGARFWQSLR